MSRILLLVVLFACLACGRPSPAVLDPSGEVVPDARADYLFSDEEGRDWFLCGAPGFLFSLAVSEGESTSVILVPKPSSEQSSGIPDHAPMEGAAHWFDLRNPTDMGFVLDLSPAPMDPLPEFLLLRLREQLSVWRPHLLVMLKSKDLTRAAQEALAPQSRGGLLWVGKRRVPPGGGRGIVPPSCTDWSCDQALVWTPADAAACNLDGRTSGAMPTPAEFLGRAWIVVPAVPGSAICWDESPSPSLVVLGDQAGSQQRELAGRGAFFEQVTPGPARLALLGPPEKHPVHVQLVPDLQLDAGRIAWLGSYNAPEPQGSVLSVAVDLDVQGDLDGEWIDLEIASQGALLQGQPGITLRLPLWADGTLLVRGLDEGFWGLRIVAPAGWLLEGQSEQSLELGAEAACTFDLVALPAVDLEVDLASTWGSRGPHLLTLHGSRGRLDLSLDLRREGGILWNSAHRIPIGDYLVWMRPRAADPRGRDVAFARVSVGLDGRILLVPEPGLVLVEEAAPGERASPRGRPLLLATDVGGALDPRLRIVPRRRSDGNAATELLSSKMILLDEVGGARVFDRGLPAAGYSVE
ncbi:MAG TPA: hypothetical protein EYQ25_13195 [Planctomycetes bacterium]|nr:hypothetical protein [Planctomycetota bacterium]HIL38627.1 hypothetical protein [Planctomycetota bacterium]